jgi:hypothetical protein
VQLLPFLFFVQNLKMAQQKMWCLLKTGRTGNYQQVIENRSFYFGGLHAGLVLMVVMPVLFYFRFPYPATLSPSLSATRPTI